MAMSTYHKGGPWVTKVWEMLNQTRSLPYHAVLASLLAKAAEKAFWWSVCGLYHSQELLITGCGSWKGAEVVVPLAETPALSLRGKPHLGKWKALDLGVPCTIPGNSLHYRVVTTRIRGLWRSLSPLSCQHRTASGTAKTLITNMYWALTTCGHFAWVILFTSHNAKR